MGDQAQSRKEDRRGLGKRVMEDTGVLGELKTWAELQQDRRRETEEAGPGTAPCSHAPAQASCCCRPVSGQPEASVAYRWVS